MASAASSADPWDAPAPNSGGKNASRVQAQPVKDDWDDDDSADEDDNKKIWEDANSKNPMPQVVAASGPVASIPAAAFQGPVKILKRTNPLTQSTISSTAQASNGAPQTYAEREARYQAARQRIFAGPSDVMDKGAKSAKVTPQPLGPDKTQETTYEASFAGRRPKVRYSSPAFPASFNQALGSISIS
ncbi:hypothetical protein K488DRAFT_81556 [Vararia minispora EC-137]|uniref:Uncharacterized protein n=1 Tax=Vararia minispora EC-137 TaxID=1314806 RepID=A0ACB8QYV5_9AGAM|nr:hypothetical protein K488DRAFT_81556 [Vararia minispora EC-137]